MVWERAASESKLPKDVRKLSGHPAGVLPGKLRNPWTGPYKMLRRNGERKCIILKDGKEAEYSVTRLFKVQPWDKHHLDSSGIISGPVPIAKASKAPKPKQKYPHIPATPPRVGEIIIFPLPVDVGHKSPFGWAF